MTRIVDLRQVTKTYSTGPVSVRALNGVSMAMEDGELLAVHGRSGSGKTTLLNIIGGLDRADGGQVTVCGTDLVSADEADLTELRRRRVAFVFQSFGLLPVLSAAENVEVPLRLTETPVAERRRRVTDLLELVGLGGRAKHRPAELSGGEQQRVAIARALAADPQILIADEPTGQLDSKTGASIMALIRRLVRDTGLAAVVATHDQGLIEAAHHRIELRDGAVHQDAGLVH
jgi:putative ABC transport system ATP-binding protein